MKAARYRKYGGPEQIELADLPDPTPATGEVVVRVRATSINPIDWKLVTGELPFRLVAPKPPCVPGFDIAGEVATAAGPFAVGDRVYARLPGRRGGACAELVACAHAYLARIPATMSFEQAAAIPLAACTALQGLRDGARLAIAGTSGKRVLINGASGGVGHFGVQIARALGAHVTGVCSTRNLDFVKSLGADAVIDYTVGGALADSGRYDAILDCVGGAPIGPFLQLLARGGAYVTCLPRGEAFARQFASYFGAPRVRGVMMQPSASDLALLDRWFEAGTFRAEIEHIYPLAQLADAHRASIAGRTRGKLVVTL